MGGLEGIQKVAAGHEHTCALRYVASDTATNIGFGSYLRHVLWIDGAFHVESSADSFTRRFAPMETPEEALALAVALTGARADHELDYPTLRAKAARMETTFAESEEDGFDDGECGCSLHPISAVDFHVRRDGGIERRRSEEIFELTEPMCYD